jgi:hypothetical protein
METSEVRTDENVVAAQAAMVDGSLIAPAKRAVEEISVHRVNLKELFVAQDGRFVVVDFVKQDGCCRSLNGRLGVRKHLKGGVNTVEGEDKPYITVFDVKTPGYRAVNLATVSRMRAENRVYNVVG